MYADIQRPTPSNNLYAFYNIFISIPEATRQLIQLPADLIPSSSQQPSSAPLYFHTQLLSYLSVVLIVYTDFIEKCLLVAHFSLATTVVLWKPKLMASYFWMLLEMSQLKMPRSGHMVLITSLRDRLSDGAIALRLSPLTLPILWRSRLLLLCH